MIIIVMLGALVAMLFEYRLLKKQGNYREIGFSASLLTVGLLLSGLVYFKVQVPSPLLGIGAVFKPIDQFVNNLLL